LPGSAAQGRSRRVIQPRRRGTAQGPEKLDQVLRSLVAAEVNISTPIVDGAARGQALLALHCEMANLRATSSPKPVTPSSARKNFPGNQHHDHRHQHPSALRSSSATRLSKTTDSQKSLIGIFNQIATNSSPVTPADCRVHLTHEGRGTSNADSRSPTTNPAKSSAR